MKKPLSAIIFLLTLLGVLHVSPALFAYVETGSNTVLLMHFNEGDGQNVYDESSNGLHGIRGSSTATTTNDPTWVTPPSGCRFGNCFDFNDDWVRVTDNNALDITGNLTVEAWVASDDTDAGGQTFISKWRTDSIAQSSYMLRVDSSNDDVEFCLSDGSTAFCVDTNDTGTVCTNVFNTNGQIYHLAGTYNATTDVMAIWVNGILCTTLAGPTAINASGTDLLIGSVFTGAATIDTGGGALDGRVDEVRIRSTIPDDSSNAAEYFNPGPVIQSVTHTPTSGNETWTIYNGGGATIDLEGWVFEQCSSSANYIVPTAGTHNLAAGATVTISVGAGADGAATYFTANGTGGTDISSLGASDCLRVYGQATTADNTIIDAVVWGADAGTGDDEAVTAGLWRDGTYVSTVPTLNQETIELFTTQIATETKIGDNEEGVLDWARSPYTAIKGENSPRASGDWYSADGGAGGTRNIIYEYFIEVPSSSPTLRLELWDADIGNDGGAGEANANRDRTTGTFNTNTVYRLVNPSGTTVATYTGDATNGTDNTFMTPDGFRVTTPATGTWTLEVDATGQGGGGTGADINRFLPRAEGFQIKTNYTQVGSNSPTAPLNYVFYPWVKSGCSINVYDFDSDNTGTYTFAQQINIRNINGATAFNWTLSNASFSGNDVWAANNNTTTSPAGFINDAIQSDYGAFALVGTVAGYNTPAANGNYVPLEMQDYNGGDLTDAGDMDTDADVISMYLPVDNGGPPNVPYLLHFYDVVSGPNPMVTSSTTTVQVTVGIINFTGTTLTGMTVNAQVPGGEVVYQGTSAVVGQGSITAQPADGGSGTITWNAGSVASSGSTAWLIYQVRVTPTSGGRKIFTGTPGANGTRATYTSAHSSSETIGQICELAGTVGSTLATYVELAAFTATPYEDAVLLEWETATEIDNLGFNVYRSLSPEGPFVQINSSLIYGLLTNIAGGRYYFVDQGVEAGHTYYYLVEDIDLNGLMTRHGPVAATPNGGLPLFGDSSFDPFGYTGGGWFNGEEDAEVESGDDSGGLVAVPAVQIQELENAIYIDLYPEAPQFSTVTVDGNPYSRMAIPGYSASGEPCYPEILERNLVIPVPNRKLTFTVEGMDILDLDIPDGIPWPHPAYELNEWGTGMNELFCLDAAAYATAGPLPGAMVEWLGAHFTGDERHGAIRVFPVQVNALDNTLSYARHMVLKITFGEDLPPEEIPGSVDLPDQVAHFALAGDATAVKIRILEPGIYRIPFVELEAAGFAVGSNAANWRLFYEGREQAILLTESDLLFYGVANDDPQAEALNTYWLIADTVSGLRMEAWDGTPSSGDAVEVGYWDSLTLEENHFYHFTLPEGEGRDHWFWKYALAPGNYAANFDLPGLQSEGSEEVLVEVFLQGVTAYAAAPDHHARILLNSTVIADVQWNDQEPYAAQVSVPVSLLEGTGNEILLQMPGDLPGVPYDAVYLNRYVIHYPRAYKAHDNILSLSTSLYGPHEVSGFTGESPMLFVVTDEENPAYLTNFEFEAEEGMLRYQSPDQPFGSEILAVDFGALLQPVEIVPNLPSTLHDPANRGGYLILAPTEFLEALTPFAQYRESRGHEVMVVDTQEIYDEFGFGVQSPTAIKEFLRYAHIYWARKPQYVLLVGDGTYDPKGYLGAVAGNTNFIPSPLVETAFMQASSDSWYGRFDEESARSQLMIGRLPVESPEELLGVLERIILYETTPDSATWERRVTLVQDDVDQEPTDLHFAETMDSLTGILPAAYQANRISESLAGGVLEARAAIADSMNAGTLLVNYVGHGGIQLWASEQLFTNADAAQVNFQDRFPVVVAMNCLNSFYAYPGFESLGEVLVTRAHGGAIAYWSSSGLTTPQPQALLNIGLYESLFGTSLPLALQTPKTLGQAIAQAGAGLEQSTEASDVLKTWTLLGDPALELKIPVTAAQIPTAPSNPSGNSNTNPGTENSSSAGCRASRESQGWDLAWMMMILVAGLYLGRRLGFPAAASISRTERNIGVGSGRDES